MTTTTVPIDPEQAAILNQFCETPLADAKLDEDILKTLTDAGHETCGDIWTATIDGENFERLNKVLKSKDDREILEKRMHALLAEQKVLAREAAKKADKPRPKASNGKKGYTHSIPAKLGKYTSNPGSSCSVKITIGLAGEDGVAGIRPGTAHRFFCGRQIDLEISEGDQGTLEGMGLEPFYGVGATNGLSNAKSRKAAGTTISFVHADVNHQLLERYAGRDVTLRFNPPEELAESDSDDDYEEATEPDQAQAA
ncbi:MAG: hypothetical protein AAGI37_19530 [Planctomycetota bacterium]